MSATEQAKFLGGGYQNAATGGFGNLKYVGIKNRWLLGRYEESFELVHLICDYIGSFPYFNSKAFLS
ncbi:hypothetical protein Verru16b_03532 [Lacunisphaera limnophila]|uniref:Uncharacterized protein n=1 Tax=Lacunisphaera limnophila TaxID=1838286 RepID=A0A1D8AZU8_9BACT|nr:hypothetical protein Verru16b_03532 [Lacunisphaera limnophila]